MPFLKRKGLLHKIVCGGAQPGNLLISRMPSTPAAEITGLYRYPVKGLTPEALERVALGIGQTLPSDRRYAIENGPSGFDPAAPSWMPKSVFLMLMRNQRLAGFRAHFEDETHLLTIRERGEEVARGDLETAQGRAAIEGFFARNFTSELKGPPKVVSSRGHSFSDVAKKVVSIINLGSLGAIETMVGTAVHPLRFRANLYVRGWPAWHEFTCSAGRSRLARRGSRWSSTSPAAPPSTSIPTPPRATSTSPQASCAVSATMNAASMPR